MLNLTKKFLNKYCGRERGKSLALLISVAVILTAVLGTTLAFVVTQTSPLRNIFKPFLDPYNDLTITKSVSHPFGENYDIPEGISFRFQVELGFAYADQTVETSQGEMTADDKGMLEVQVSPGTPFQITGLEDGMDVTVTEVQLDGDGFEVEGEESQTLTISSQENAVAAFVNHYAPAPVSDVNISLSGTKTLEGRAWKDGDSFTFGLEYRFQDDDEWTDLAERTVTYDVDDQNFNRFDFGSALQEMEFSKAGTYAFHLFEKEGTLGGFTYENVESYFDVLVGDADMDGKLEIQNVSSVRQNTQISRGEDGNFNVTVSLENVYVTAGEAEVIISIKKILNDKSGNKMLPEGFSFVLCDADGNEIKTSAATSAAGETSIKMVYSAEDRGKVFSYVLKENAGTVPGMTYDDREYALKVAVGDDQNGNVKAVIFDSAANVDLQKLFGSFEGDSDESSAVDESVLAEESAATDESPVEDESVLTEESTAADESALPEESMAADESVSTEESVAGESVSAEESTAADAGVSTEEGSSAAEEGVSTEENSLTDENSAAEESSAVDGNVSEQMNASAEAGAISDSDEKDGSVQQEFPETPEGETAGEFFGLEKVFLSAVSVTGGDVSGQIESESEIPAENASESEGPAESASESERFAESDDEQKTVNYRMLLSAPEEISNRYSAEFINTYDPVDAEITIGGNKVLEGRALKAGEFVFALYETNSNFVVETDQLPCETAVNDGTGAFSFEKMTFDKTGKHYFVVTEDDSAALGGITYDDAAYHVTVQVTDNQGELKADIRVADESGQEKEKIEFINNYAVSPVYVKLNGQKKLNGAALTKGMFTFKLYEADENFAAAGDAVDTAKNDADGSFGFEEMKYTSEGIWRYVVLEDDSQKRDRMTYDDSIYQITVEVKDDGKGALAKETTIVKKGQGSTDQLLFVNTYTPAPEDVAVKISVKKTVKNVGTESIGPENFEFVLKNVEDGERVALRTDKNGRAVFTLNCTEKDAGKSFHYQLSETNEGKANVTYSEKVYDIRLDVTQNADGTLKAVLCCDGEQYSSFEAQFVNIYDKGKKAPEESETPEESSKESEESIADGSETMPETETVIETETAEVTETEAADSAPARGGNTGDSSMPLWYMILSSGCLIAILLILKKHRKHK